MDIMKIKTRRILLWSSLLLAAAHAAPSLSADSNTELHGAYAHSVNDGAEGSKRCSLSLVDDFTRLALFNVALSTASSASRMQRNLLHGSEQPNTSSGGLGSC